MTIRPGRIRRAISVAACGGLVVATASACFAEASAMPAVRDFLIAWQVGNYEAAAKQTVGADQKTVADTLSQVRDQLDAASMKLGLGVPPGKAINRTGEDADARFSVKIDLGENGEPFIYVGQLHLKRVKGRWKVVWNPSIIHPNLRDGQRLAVVTETQPRADVQDAGGRSVLRKVRADFIGVVPGQLTDPHRTITQLADAAKIDGRKLDAERLLGRVRSAPPNAFLPLLTLQRSEHAALISRLHQVRGLRFKPTTASIDPALAPELVGSLGPATADRLQQVGAPYQPGDTIGVSGIQFLQQRRLAGTPTVKVVAQDPSGGHRELLREWPGKQEEPVRTSIDPVLQGKAQKALAGLQVPASMAVVRAATGEVLSVVNHRTGGHNQAMEGHYPPGYTFGIVTAEALFQAGMTDRDKTDCPATTSVGDQTFTNPGAARGQDRLQMNFAFSCATTMATLSTRIDGPSLMQAVAKFGLGKEWGLTVPAFSGSIPPPASDAEKATTALGQGKVLVSPLAMALTAGAVATGTWRPPLLLLSPLDKPALLPQVLDPGPAGNLKRLMQRSVVSGSARAAKLGPPSVHGVVATVNYTEGSRTKTVSWFVGFRGEHAFAIAIEGNVPAAKIVTKFFTAR